MTELLLSNVQKDINSTVSANSSGSNFLSSYDNVYETLIFVRPKSCYKRPLTKMLARIYKNNILIIWLSFIIGFIFFGVPMILIYIKLINNTALFLLIICGFGFLISVLFIIIPCIDSYKYNYMISAKWERNNILKNIGNIFLFLLLLISVVFAIIFYGNILDKKIKFDDKNNFNNSKVFVSDFLFKYIIYILLFENDKIDDIKNNKIKVIFIDSDMKKLKNGFINICLPLIIIIFFTLIKIFLIEVRQTIEKVMFFGGLFTLLLFQCFINSISDYSDLLKIKISSIFENIIIIVILFGYILWNVNYTILIQKKKKNKNFAIRKYNNNNILIIIIIDIITCLGYCIIIISILYCYIAFNYKAENFYYFYISFIIFKIGFIPIIFGNTYYFGYYFLSMIFRPIAIYYAPSELKNNYYIKKKQKLYNFLIAKKRRKTNQKLIKNKMEG